MWTMREILRRRSEDPAGPALLKWDEISVVNNSNDQK